MRKMKKYRSKLEQINLVIVNISLVILEIPYANILDKVQQLKINEGS